MTFDFANIAATAAITGLIQLGIWASIQRSIERRDKKLDELEHSLIEMRDQRVKKIEDEYVSRSECDLLHAPLRERLKDGKSAFSEINAKLDLLGNDVAVLKANQRQISQSLKLTWREP